MSLNALKDLLQHQFSVKDLQEEVLNSNKVGDTFSYSYLFEVVNAEV